ncbi:MAG: PDZ domain-containing protein [Verrucomicrobiota bacterium]|nr:PDZ domain-containing protein [Verrucomicrobiota bacterium]
MFPTRPLFFCLALLLVVMVLPAPALAAAKAKGLLRINTTIQTYNVSQPWELNQPQRRRGLGAILEDGNILTTGEMAANSTYIEFESADGAHTVPAEGIAIDYEANLALLKPEKGANREWIDKLGTLGTNGPAKIDDKVNIWQFEDNGDAIRTEGTVRSVDLLSTFASGHYFLCYEVKASMQSASSSYTLPVTRNGRLLGILASYNSKDQISDVVAPDILKRFLEDVRDGRHEGFPSLGIATVLTEDPQFRKWLGLTDEQGGLYVSRLLPGSGADESGLKKGDVLLTVNGHAIDRRGYYEDPTYGRLVWSHLVRGSRQVGDKLALLIMRDGKEQQLEAVLRRPPDHLIPSHMYDKAPPYLIKGGLVFQELTRPYLEAFGKEWRSRAPLDLLDALNNPEDYEEGRKRLVFLSRVIRTPATIGYDQVNNLIVTEANGQKVTDMTSLAAALNNPKDGLHSIRIDDIPYVIYLDPEESDLVDKALLKRGLPALQRLP